MHTYSKIVGLMEVVEMSVLFSVTFLAGAIVVWTRPLKKDTFGLLLTFGGAFLIGLSFLHLLPGIFGGVLAYPGWYLLAGFLVQVLLELGSRGIEHGHTHDHHHGKKPLTFTLMIALGVHAIIEGMPFGSHDHDHALLLGILLHKVPVAMVLASFVLSAQLSRLKSLGVVFGFALMAPLGTLLYYLIGQYMPNRLEELTVACTAVLVGMLLHISTTILFESSEGHKLGMKKLAAIVIGVALSVASGLM